MKFAEQIEQILNLVSGAVVAAVRLGEHPAWLC